MTVVLMSKRRTRYDLMRVILESLRINGAMGITRLSYAANLPVDRTKKIVETLLEKGFIHVIKENTYTLYVLTARGGELLNALQVIKNYLSKE